DKLVTGVQTCALPIFAPMLLERLLAALRHNPEAAYATAWAHGLDPSAVPLGNYANFVPEHDNAAVAPLMRRDVFERGHRFDASRSEERRVGKECRARW